MFEVAGLVLVTIGTGAWLAGWNFKGTRVSYFPLSVALFLGFFGLAAIVFYSWMRFDFRLLGAVWICSLLLTRLVLSLAKNIAFEFAPSARMLGGIFILAILLNVDTAVIFQRQGWAGVKQETYFRPPMHNDVERHVVVNNALLRHAGSPMLTGSPFLYQLFWHHLSAVYTGVFPEGLTRYYQVGGVIWATGVLFTWVVLVAAVGLAQGMFSKVGFVLFGALAFFHTDLFNFVLSILRNGAPAIEADWSAGDSLFLRCFSLKLIALTAPQHALFFIFLVFFLTFQHAPGSISARVRRYGSGLFFIFALLVSPLMVAFFFLPYGLYRVLGKAEIKWIPIPELCLGYGLYRYLFGFWPHELAMRPGTSSITYFLSDWKQIAQLPLAAVIAAGIPGVLATWIGIQRGRRLGSKLDYIWAPAILGSVLFGWIATDNEIRRHYAMILSFGVTWFLATEMPSLRKLNRRVLGVGTLLAVILQGYFVYCYVGKPSVIDPALAWGDYLKMNHVLAHDFPRLPVIGVSDPKGSGIEKPLAMEVTSAFSMPPHAVIHSRVEPEQFRLLQKILSSGDVAPYARSLGYRAMIWGPAEKRLWGQRVANRFLCPENKLAETGEVALYWLCDRLRTRFDSEPNKNSADFYFRVAEAFNREGWPQEALGYYFQAVALGPDHRPAHEALANLLERYDRKEEAAELRANLN